MRIEALIWDEGNESEIAAHGLVPEDIEAIVGGSWPFLIVRNKRNRPGHYKLIGRGRGGEFLTVIISATEDSGTWRPITGWHSDTAEIAAAKRRGM